jgi:hypothetical protein
MKSSLFVLTALALASSGFAKPAADEVPPAKNNGAAESCVYTQDIRDTRVRSDNVIDFVMNSGKVYRNTLPYACAGLGFEERFMYRLSTSRLCNVDIITVLQSPGLMRGASCGLGDFQPVELIKTEKKK